MTLIEALRNRTDYADRISDEVIIRETKGTFVYHMAELDVLKSKLGYDQYNILHAIQESMQCLSVSISKLEHALEQQSNYILEQNEY